MNDSKINDSKIVLADNTVWKPGDKVYCTGIVYDASDEDYYYKMMSFDFESIKRIAKLVEFIPLDVTELIGSDDKYTAFILPEGYYFGLINVNNCFSDRDKCIQGFGEYLELSKKKCKTELNNKIRNLRKQIKRSHSDYSRYIKKINEIDTSELN